jgi:nucleotide-binding universal stress UspA family protein
MVLPTPEWDEATRKVAVEGLAATLSEVQKSTRIPVISELREGVPAEQIVQAARDRDARAIICTTHGHGGWAPEWLGSVTDAVVREARCPVIAIGERATGRPPGVRSILVLIDGTAESETILPEASQLAEEFDAEMTLVRVVAPEWIGSALMRLPPRTMEFTGLDAFAIDVKQDLEKTAARYGRRGRRVRSVVISDANPIGAILAHIKETDPDLVAAATSSRGFSRLFLRSVADKVLRAGGRPTLLYHKHAEPPIRGPRKASKRPRRTAVR